MITTIFLLLHPPHHTHTHTYIITQAVENLLAQWMMSDISWLTGLTMGKIYISRCAHIHTHLRPFRHNTLNTLLHTPVTCSDTLADLHINKIPKFKIVAYLDFQKQSRSLTVMRRRRRNFSFRPTNDKNDYTFIFNAVLKSIYLSSPLFLPKLQFNLASHPLGCSMKSPLFPVWLVLLICHYVMRGRKSMGLPLNNHHKKTREIYHGETISNWNTQDAQCKQGNIFSASYGQQRRSWCIILSFADSGVTREPDGAYCCEGFFSTLSSTNKSERI